jgi:hypothetical protein
MLQTMQEDTGFELGQLTAGFPLWRTGFKPGSCHVRPVVNKAALRQVSFAKYFTEYSTLIIMHPYPGLVQYAVYWPQ